MRTSRYIVTASARRDLRSIQNYLLQNSGLGTADRIMGDFEAAFQKLARSPGIGHSRGDLVDEEFSLFRVHSWMVIYRPRAKPMRIIRVLHSARDIHELLG